MSTMAKGSEVGASEAKDEINERQEDAPAYAVNVAEARKEPPPEKPEQIRMRSFVLLSFWAIVIFLGLPIWWKTTTIYRANLPLDQMMDWADGRVSFLHLRFDIGPKLTLNRHVGQSFHFKYQYKQIHYKITKLNTFYEQPNTHWTT
jgi:hypothetical protein